MNLTKTEVQWKQLFYVFFLPVTFTWFNNACWEFILALFALCLLKLFSYVTFMEIPARSGFKVISIFYKAFWRLSSLEQNRSL